MSAIRLLILGVLKQKEPIHGYEVRRELEMWNAEQWANIAYGSIYFALNKMAEEGLLEAVNKEETGTKPAKILYKITELGKGEFERLLREFWWQIKPVYDPFQVALTFMNALPPEEILAALRHRADNIRAFLSASDWMFTGKMAGGRTPRHIKENLKLAISHSETELRWIEDILKKVENGELP